MLSSPTYVKCVEKWVVVTGDHVITAERRIGAVPKFPRNTSFNNSARTSWQQRPDSLRKNPLLNDSMRRLPDISKRSSFSLISNTTKSIFWAFSFALNTACRTEVIRRIDHFRITIGLLIKASPGARPLIRKLISFACEWIWFSCEGMNTGTRFEREAKSISEVAYSRKVKIDCKSSNTIISLYGPRTETEKQYIGKQYQAVLDHRLTH